VATAKCEQAALDYLSRGWSVIPIRKREKRPAIRWQSFQHDCPSEQDVHGWFSRWPKANVAIVTGAVSGIVVLDVDTQYGGGDSLEQLERDNEPLPDTLEVKTGGGGRHLYFEHPGDILRNRVGIVPGIDIRGDGGCIVAPPSRHPSGKRYKWVKDRGPGQATLAPLPNWLEQIIRSHDKRPGRSPDSWRDLLRDGVSEGERNDTIASITGNLLWHDVDPDVALELMLCWNRIRCCPPLDDEEVTRTVHSIARIHERH
jgi:hypothetical protein